jgi:hypothetical protein
VVPRVSVVPDVPIDASFGAHRGTGTSIHADFCYGTANAQPGLMMTTTARALLPLLLLVAACGGAVEDPAGSNGQGVAACATCEEPREGETGGAAGGSTAPAPTSTAPTPAPAPVPSTTSTSPTPTPAPSTPSNAIAMRGDQLPPVDAEGGGTGGGGVPDDSTIANKLFLFLGDHAPACSSPFASMGCGSHWQISIPLAPAYQTPGKYALEWEGIGASFSVTGPDEPNSACWGGGGSFFGGTVEILSIDETEVRFRLSGTPDTDFHADGDYTAPRCP